MTERRPEALERVDADAVVEVDVRDDLRSGREPFARIMSAVQEVPPGGALCLRAIFEPAPLYRVLGSRGFAHWTEKLADDDWRIWFYADEGAGAPAAATEASEDGRLSNGAASGGDMAAGATEDVVILDVRGLEPPEPMVRTLEALETLPAGATLVQLNVRVPQFLLPKLEERGFTYEVRRQGDDLVRVFIRRG